ncbi:glycosyltransferase family 39 protein [Rhizobium tubonense]|uniref:Dolichyl-phosphate beta-D-mannosyltransferase n=1 Tax=Rhizobium tubonense TaxID=484088 RepID=A0A2W4CP43_9HYPH|nr:glycosyltransferase family 39 protein [Rhizobium tubonense]PZM14482.1 dolichyl-phosphate beta-D-mannosyltransferase [Rhizobium tubonense]
MRSLHDISDRPRKSTDLEPLQRNAVDLVPRVEHRQSVSVVVPTLNEVENIDVLLSSLLLQSSADIALEILVADGGSTDGTVERVRVWEAKAPVRLISGSGARGLAGDVLAAARSATGDIVVVMDADLSHPPDEIGNLVGPIVDGTSDMVVGSRYVPGGSTPDWPLARRLLSRLGGALAWPLTDLQDPMSGFFAVRKERLLAVDPEAAGFKIGLEVIADGGDALRVSEVPIVFHDRVRGESKIGWGQMIAYARRLLVLAGGAVSLGNAARFAAVGLIGLALDILIFQILFAMGAKLVTAHVVSFVVATVSNYILNSRWAFASDELARRERDWRRYIRFLTICLLAFALRGGVLAGAVELLGWHPQAAILLGVGAAAVVNYFGNAFFVFPSVNPRMPPDVRWRVAAIGVLVYVLALRLVFLGLVDLVPEETYYWNYSQHLDIGYLDHPPMVAWLIWLGTSLFGDTEFGVRIGAYLAWIPTAFFVFWFSRNLFGKSPAFVGVLLLATLPFFFSSGFMMMPDVPLTAAWAAALYFLERALVGNSRRAWWGVGICAGLGMLSKYTIALLGPAALIFILLDPRARRWLLRPEPYLAIIVAAVLFSPVIYWNATHGWASFSFQTSQRLQSSVNFSLPSLVGSAAILMTPIGLIAAIAALASRSGLTLGTKPDANAARQSLFIKIFTIVPLSVFVAFSLFHEIKPNWTGPVWLAVLPAIAATIVAAVGNLSRFNGFLQRLWVPTVMTTLVIYGLSLHYLVLGFPMVGYFGSVRTLPVAWEEFGAEAGRIERSVEQATGKQVLLAGMDRYFVASEIAFYDREDRDAVRTSVGRGPFGGDGLMYDYWFKPADMQGRTVILYGLKRNDLDQDSIGGHFSRLTEILEQKVTKNGTAVGSFFYRIGYDFRS